MKGSPTSMMKRVFLSVYETNVRHDVFSSHHPPPPSRGFCRVRFPKFNILLSREPRLKTSTSLWCRGVCVIGRGVTTLMNQPPTNQLATPLRAHSNDNEAKENLCIQYKKNTFSKKPINREMKFESGNKSCLIVGGG